MSQKTTIVQKNSFDIIRSAVNKTVDLIKPTFGPASNKVIIAKVTHGMVVDDGVQIARDLELTDPVEHAIMKVVREVAIKTNDRVGDGTTGSLILLQAIIEEVALRTSIDGRKIEKELKAGLEECKAQLLKMAKTIKTKEDLQKVAMVSFDNPEVAKIIADAWYQLGVDGTLTVDRSGTMETFSSLTEGVKIDNGYISPYMITNPDRMESVIEKPYILFTDYRLTEAKDVINIMDQLFSQKINNLVIIAENVEGSALSTLVINKVQGKFNAVAINAPKADMTNSLEDMAIMTGGKVFSEKKGDKIDLAKIEDLGRADRFIARRTESVIVGPRGKKDNIKKAIASLKAAMLVEENAGTKRQLNTRLSRFTNKVGVINVGAATENEVNALRYKADDAVHAVHAAFKSGVVAGGGVSLCNLKTSSSLLNAALKAPFRQLKTNCGIGEHKELAKDEAINAVTGEIGNWMKIGVMDPVDVLIAQLESAVSIASILVSVTGMIVEDPAYIKQEGQ